MATEQEILRTLEKKLNKEYQDTLKVVQDKIDDFTKDFEKDNKLYLKMLKDGKIDEKAYKKWYKKQVTTAKWCNEMISELSNDMTNANVKASEIINGNTSEMFIQGYLDSSDELEDVYKFDLIDRKQAEILLNENEDLLPQAKVDIPKDKQWNKNRMRSAVLQSAIKGESIPKLAKRLEYVVGMNKTSAVRNARTMMTSTHNLGKLQTGYEALNMGINVKKKWIATPDSRTRDSHRHLNGKIVAMNEKFENGLLYPADPDGRPEEVYNCRCTLAYEIGKPDSVGNFESASFEAEDNYIKSSNSFEDEFKAKKYVGLSLEESDAFIEKYHNKQIIGKKKENTLDGRTSKRINSYLRKGEMPPDDKDRRLVERLDKAITKNKLPYDMTLFRGVPLQAFEKEGIFDGFNKIKLSMDSFKDKDGNVDYNAYGIEAKKVEKANAEELQKRAKTLIGKTISDGGYLQVSASSDRNIFNWADINLQIHAPEGTNAYISDYILESEIFLGRNTNLNILDVLVGESTVLDMGIYNNTGKKIYTSKYNLQIIAEIVD